MDGSTINGLSDRVRVADQVMVEQFTQHCLPLFSLHLAGNSRRALVLVGNLDRRVGPKVVIPAGRALLPEAGPDDGKVADEGNAQQWCRTGPPGARTSRNDGDNRDT